MKWTVSWLHGRILYAAVALLPLSAWSCRRQPAPVTPTASPPSSQPAPPVLSATPAPPDQPPPASYVDVVRLHNPGVPATQPLDVPVELRDAAHLLLPEPIYVDPLGHLWITRADAPPIDMEFFRHIADRQVHLVRRHVLFVAWYPVDNQLTPLLICTANSDQNKSPIAIDRSRTTTLPAGIISGTAPSRRSILYTSPPTPASAPLHWQRWPKIITICCPPADIADVAAGRKTFAAPRMVFDWRGQILAWIPCDDRARPGTGRRDSPTTHGPI
jgi:hypothetical protein